MSSLPMSEYQVGVVCALPKEMAAVIAMMDEEHGPLKRRNAQDHNSYTLGRIHQHNVVVACLPAGVYGTNSAAAVAKDMLRTFTGVRVGLMVGIGGGVPDLPKNDVRLGDVVVSQPDQACGGVVQYDLGKSLTGGAFERTGSLDRPPTVLLTALSALQTRQLLCGSQVSDYMKEAIAKYPRMSGQGYSCPGVKIDQLHCTSCHTSQPQNVMSSQCETCDDLKAYRTTRLDASPVIHYGTIASGNKLVKDVIIRDQLRQQLGAKCVEMEAAGLMNEFPCIVIRGICDYADSYKNDEWQEYAALTAAAFAKELLLYLVPEQVNIERPLQEMASLFREQITVSERLLDETRQQHETAQARYQNDQYRMCHHAFKTSRYEDFKNVNPQRVPGTCQWVFNNSTYKRWQESQHHDLICISADPGCGKSVLARSLIDNELQSNEDRKVCYFFFKDNEDQNKLCTALSALLHQLFDLEPRLLAHAMQAWGKNQDKVAIETDEMWRILLAAAKDSKAPSVVCVLDALDECRDDDRSRLIDNLSQFYQAPAAESFTDQKCRLKFLVTGRPYSDIQYGFQMPSHLPSIRLRGEEESEQIHIEINAVIKIRVHTLAHDLELEPGVRDRIENELLRMENRTYLWLYLVIESIRETFSHSLWPEKESIEHLPATVEDAYGKILSRVKKSNQDRVKLILQIVLGARRPLTIGEVAIALGIATLRHKDARMLKDVIISETRLEKQIRQWCGLFVVFHQKRLHLIHQTAKEFLVRKESSTILPTEWRQCLTFSQCESIMAHICINFLLFQDVSGVGKEIARRVKASDWLVSVLDVLDPDDKVGCFAEYSVRNWVSHLKNMRPMMDSTLMTKVLSLYDTRIDSFNWWSPISARIKYRTPDQYNNALCLAALNGHEEVVQFFLDSKQYKIYEQDGRGNTALVGASEGGHESIVKLLLDRGAGVNTAGQRPSSALCRASRAGHQSIVELLLSKGAPKLNRALRTASKCGRQHIVELLLDKGADDLDNALEGAAIFGRYDVVELLLDKGAKYLDSALRAASKSGHQNIVELLLSKGAQKLNRILEVASMLGCHNLIVLLLNERVSVLNAALFAASEGGNQAIVQLLLDKGAVDLDSALGIASTGGRRHEKVIELLCNEIARREEHFPRKKVRRNWDLGIYGDVYKPLSLNDDIQVVSENCEGQGNGRYNLRRRGPR